MFFEFFYFPFFTNLQVIFNVSFFIHLNFIKPESVVLHVIIPVRIIPTEFPKYDMYLNCRSTNMRNFRLDNE